MKIYCFICRGQVLQSKKGSWDEMKPIAAKLVAEQQADVSVMELKGTMTHEDEKINWKHEVW